MDDSSASTSADPLILPSSPLGRHISPRKPNAKVLRPRSPIKQQFSSPSKSFIMDTGDAGNEQSPWRIKVTVQAEPRDGASPSKKPVTKTTTVPLKGGSSSPAKRPARRKKVAEIEESEMDVEIKRPQRKRKGTPIRRAPKRPTPAKVAQDEEAMMVEDEPNEAIATSSTKKPAKRRGRKSLGTMPAQRGQRLSQAREELDEALQEAVGQDDQDDEDGEGEDMPLSEAMQGDMTAMNEDFTMISVETLQSMKQSTSMLEDSQIGDRSAVNGSYWPSSPPDNQKSARSSVAKGESAKKADYPNISAEAQYARETPAKSFVQAFDAMSWKPTGRAAQEPTPAESSELQLSSGKKQAAANEEQWENERQQVSQQIQKASEKDVVVVGDESDAELGAQDPDADGEDAQEAGDEDDIWAEEASRSLEEDVEPSHLSRRSRQQQQPPHHQNSGTAEHLNDLFSGLSSKPPRAKIPKTWRRSSGMDFTYSDSPAHSFAQEVQDQQRKASGTSGSDGEGDEADEAEKGSGVLTPPSTDEDEEDADEEMEDQDVGDEEVGASRSLFEPDAAATELQVRDVGNANSESDEASDESGVSPDGDDTGLFWQSNLPNVYKRPTRPRMAEQRKAKDLSALLKEDESSQIEKKPSPKHSMPPPAQPAKRFPGSRLLAARREAASSSFTSTSSGEQTQVAKEKVVSSPLRKSLLKSSKVGGAVTAGQTAMTGLEDTGRQSREAGFKAAKTTHQELIDESLGDTSTSFASKASDQRQLLDETIAVAQMPPRRKVVSHVEVFQAEVEEEESLWHAAGKDEQSDEASSPAQSVDYSAASKAQYTDEYESEEEEEDAHDDESEEIEISERIADTTRSYEEHLNVSSPQKIRVNFGDSSIAGHSSLLQPKRSYPPLFSSQQQQQHQRPPSRGHRLQHQQEHTLISKPQPSEPGLLGRLTSTFWSAVTRPPVTEPVFPTNLRTQLRSRYGVLSNQHPWTMSHMRTLHRMMNSCTSGKSDSLVPQTGDLPSSLLPLVGRKMKDPSGRQFVLTEQHAQCVWALTQTLVSPTLITSMERGEIDFLGDSMALACRGFFDEYDGRPRHGRDVVFRAEQVVVKPKPVEGELVGVLWVARCVGACVFAQREFEAREERIRRERRGWEERNGVVEDDYGGDGDGDESEVLEKVRRV